MTYIITQKSHILTELWTKSCWLQSIPRRVPAYAGSIPEPYSCWPNGICTYEVAALGDCTAGETAKRHALCYTKLKDFLQ